MRQIAHARTPLIAHARHVTRSNYTGGRAHTRNSLLSARGGGAGGGAGGGGGGGGGGVWVGGGGGGGGGDEGSAVKS